MANRESSIPVTDGQRAERNAYSEGNRLDAVIPKLLRGMRNSYLGSDSLSIPEDIVKSYKKFGQVDVDPVLE
jgi:hypothetical protein